MNALVILLIVALGCAGCASTHTSAPRANVRKPLRPYVRQIASELDKVPADRQVLLSQIAATIATRLESAQEANLTFICTQNSRRSQMSQIWAQTAASYYRLDQVHAFSGGTQPTECNCRTVSAMRRVGFSIRNSTAGTNPVYQVRYADDRPALRAYSKLYNADDNPKTNFIALMTCSIADRTCPVVAGASARCALHYLDPKVCDDTPDETSAYNERCREIAREMFYIMSEVRKRLDGQVSSGS